MEQTFTPGGRSAASFGIQVSDEISHLHRYALSLTGDPHEAEDLVQDCVLRAMDRRAQFRPGTHLRRWLFTILRNLNIDRHRQRMRQGVHISIGEEGADLPRSGGQEAHVALVEIAERLKGMRPCDRQVMAMSVFAGLSHEETAERLDVAVGTVKSRLSRMRRALGE